MANKKSKSLKEEWKENIDIMTYEELQRCIAPTAVNQQKFMFEYVGMKDNRHYVKPTKGFSLVGYTQIDLGIVKYHFEHAIGAVRFVWL